MPFRVGCVHLGVGGGGAGGMKNQTLLHESGRRKRRNVNPSEWRSFLVAVSSYGWTCHLMRYFQLLGISDKCIRSTTAPEPRTLPAVEMVLKLTPWLRNTLEIGFVVNETSKSFSLKCCRCSDISTSDGFVLRSGQITVGTVVGEKNGFCWCKLSGLAVLLFWGFPARCDGRAGVASRTWDGRAKLLWAFVRLPFWAISSGHSQYLIASEKSRCFSLEKKIFLFDLTILWSKCSVDLYFRAIRS